MNVSSNWHTITGWWQLKYFLFPPIPGGRFPFWLILFQKGLKPPTRLRGLLKFRHETILLKWRSCRHTEAAWWSLDAEFLLTRTINVWQHMYDACNKFGEDLLYKMYILVKHHPYDIGIEERLNWTCSTPSFLTQPSCKLPKWGPFHKTAHKNMVW